MNETISHKRLDRLIIAGSALVILGCGILIALQFLNPAPPVGGTQYVNRDLKMLLPGERRPIGAVHVLLTLPANITIGNDAQAEIKIVRTSKTYTIGPNAKATLATGDLDVRAAFRPRAPYAVPWLFILSSHTRGVKILHYQLSLPLKNLRTGKTATWAYDSFETLRVTVFEDFWGKLALVGSITVILFGLITIFQGIGARHHGSAP